MVYWDAHRRRFVFPYSILSFSYDNLSGSQKLQYRLVYAISIFTVALYIKVVSREEGGSMDLEHLSQKLTSVYK